jgi:predicted dehydrogenase
VCGCGSIGKRHIRNLRARNVRDIRAFDPDETVRAWVTDNLGVVAEPDFERALEKGPTVVFVTSPSHLHASQALRAARAGAHVFVEKPLAHTRDGVDELLRAVAAKNLVTLGGCNFKFYPLVRKIKELVDGGEIGRVYSARIEAGQYLPLWRPAIDYRKNYGARRAMGGGVILDFIHELDYVHWFFGAAGRLVAFADRVGSLEIDTEDLAEILIWFRSGVLAEIHVDYLSQRYQRNVRVMGERGNIEWDWHDRAVRVYRPGVEKPEVFPLPEGYDLNQMYLDELDHFLDSMEHGRPTLYPFAEAAEVLEIALASHESAETRKVVQLGSGGGA